MPTTDLAADTLTDAVRDSFARTPSPRLKEVLDALTRHQHAFVAEVAPTIEEWEAGIDFLTATGHMCDDVRQEFILLSDVLGVSMLVETINDAETPDATDSTVLGPFHMVASPDRGLGEDISPQSEGVPCVVRGTVRSTDGSPVPGARVDVWQANALGFYDVQQPGVQDVGNGRGHFTADAAGRFWFRTVVPAHYPIPTDGPVGALLRATERHPYRPAHVHFIVTAEGHRELTTHIFVADSPYIDSDAVFAVKRSLVRPFEPDHDPDAAARHGVPSPFVAADVDIVLHPEGEVPERA